MVLYFQLNILNQDSLSVSFLKDVKVNPSLQPRHGDFPMILLHGVVHFSCEAVSDQGMSFCLIYLTHENITHTNYDINS